MSAGHGGQVLLSAAAAALAADRLPDGASLRDLGEYRLKDLGRPERVFQLLHPALEATFPPLTTLDHGAANLPIQAAPFVGRRVELAEVERRLEDPSVRLLTLTGPGGTGKTSLGIRAARRPGRPVPRRRVVRRPVRHARHRLRPARARARGRRRRGARSAAPTGADRSPPGTPDAAHARQLRAGDGGGRGDHRAPERLPGAQAARHEPRAAPRARRARLRGAAARTCPRPGAVGCPPSRLGQYESVQLFVDRARAVRPDFELDDENAGSGGRHLPPARRPAACDRARRGPSSAVLPGGAARSAREPSGAAAERQPATCPERQQTLRATIEWSYQLLEPGEQRLFELLAVFADADVEAVEAVVAATDEQTGSDVDVIEALASLLEKSLIRQVDAPGGEPRLLMLETIREYATERLDERRGGAARPTRPCDPLRRPCRATAPRSGRHRARPGDDRDGGRGREPARSPGATGSRESDLGQLTKLADSLLILNEARGWYHDTVELTTDLLAVLGATSSTPELVGQEIALRTSLARALMATQGLTPEVADAYARVARAVRGRRRDAASTTRSCAGSPASTCSGPNSTRRVELGKRILALAEVEDDPSMRIDGHLVVGSTEVFTRRPARRPAPPGHGDRAVRVESDPGGRVAAGQRPPRRLPDHVRVRPAGCWARPDGAVERANAAIELARRLDHPYTSAYAQFHSGLLHLWRREPEIVLDRAIRLLEIADEYDFRIWSAIGASCSERRRRTSAVPRSGCSRSGRGWRPTRAS